MRVVIGSDTEGMALKELIKQHLVENGHEVVDKSETASADFVDSACAVAHDVLANPSSLGIACDGYGAGSFMAASKIKGMICAEVSDERSAYMTREHNNALMLSLGSHILGDTLALNIVDEFLDASYAGGRHQIRVDMLGAMA